MSDWIVNLVEQGGYWGVAFLMFLENVFPPIPSELIMPLAGYHTEKGKLSFAGVVAAGTLGSFVGGIGWYFVGALVGKPRLQRWLDAHGHWLTLSRKDLDHAETFFQKHGGWAVLVGRMIPGVRTLISLPAGLTHMPVVPFLLYTFVGTLLWTAALAYAGRVLAAQFTEVEKFLGPASWVVMGAIGLLYVYRLIRQRGAK